MAWVYEFSEGNKDQKDLLGGKGANLAEMTTLGLPVPPGFTISTETCRAYLALQESGEGGMPEGLDEVVKQEREIRDVRFCTLEEVDELAADFTARRVRAAVSGTQPYTESGR